MGVCQRISRGEMRAVRYWRFVDAWTDERLDDLAATLRPLPAQMARNTDAIERMSEDMREMRTEMRAMHRQFALIGWTMSFSLIGALVALMISVA
jgi:nitrogen fixation/metabolism regulation signal transduction histidine kinase